MTSVSRPRIIILAAVSAILAAGWAFAADEAPEHPLSLERTVAQTVNNNFGVILERLNADVAGQERIAAEAEFDPVLGAQTTVDRGRSPGTSVFSDPEIGEVDSVTGEVSVSRKTTLGGEFKIAAQAQRTETNSTFQSIDPTFSTALTAEVTQPILKNAGTDANRWRIVISENNEKMARWRLRSELHRVITAAHEAYWEYVFSTENLKVQWEFLERAKDLEKKIRVQVDVGSLAPIEIIQAQASVASREELVIEADNEKSGKADELLRLMNPSSDDVLWDCVVVPSDSPEMEKLTFDMDKSVATALEKRPEIIIAKNEMENSSVELVYYKNQKLPSLDVLATLRMNGVRGKAHPVQDFEGNLVMSDLDGGLGDSLSDSTTGKYYDYTLGLRLTYPFGNRSARSGLAKAHLNLQSSLVKLKRLERDVILEVRDAHRRIENGIKQIEAASAARLLAEKKLEAEIRKFEVGSSTSFNVLEFQKDLAAERRNELRAMVDYRIAVVRLDKAVGRTLQANNISFEAGK